MDKDHFWGLIDKLALASNSQGKFTKSLNAELGKLSLEELLHFQFIYEIYEIAVLTARSNLIWSALYLINGGKGSDTYAFAGWLISQGKLSYMSALKNADYLANLDVKKDKCVYANFRSLAVAIYKRNSGVGHRVYAKIENQFWQSPERSAEKQAIESEIEFSPIVRNRDWELSEIEVVLPNLHGKLAQMPQERKIG
ncbi:MAG: DUF4240 domain-containing protein [Fibrobacteres bacterium]|nr:DUF4240 domain-containing protein [Fibrobacterota bacterium]